MPRGRASLQLIPAPEVVAAIGRRNGALVAIFFKVSWRTVRRWMKTGLPLRYGRTNIQPNRWGYFTRLTDAQWARFSRLNYQRAGRWRW